MEKSEEKIRLSLQKKEENTRAKQYIAQSNLFLMTSRFNTLTREQNKEFRNLKWENGCMYCAPEPITEKIPFHSKIIVLEMDNDTNKIFGIGYITNKPFVNRYSVYQDEKYNRYNYIGKYRINREDLNQDEEYVFKALDNLCFTGNEHMKRGQGLKMFPVKMLLKCKHILNIPVFIEKMFSYRFSKKHNIE